MAQRLVGDGQQVLDVPAKLAARVRVLSVGHGGQSDRDDAVWVAVAASNLSSLRQVRVEDQAVVLHLLTKRREDLVAARTQTINRWQLATEFVADVHQLEQRITAVEARIKTSVAQANTSLVELFGVGPVVAATPCT